MLIIGVSLISKNLFTQRLYFDINSGYSLGMNKDNLSFENYQIVEGSLGKGLNYSASIGYMFKKNIGIEIAGSYLSGAINEEQTENSDVISTTLANGTIVSYVYNTYFSARINSTMYSLKPSIILASGFEKIDPYVKLGVIIGKPVIEINQESRYSDTIIRKEILYGDIAFGLTAAVGTDFNINKTISLFAEINMINLSYSPAKGKLLEYYINGEDMLPITPTHYKRTEYLDSYTDYGTWINDEPRQTLKQKELFNSVGLNIGVKINF